MKLLDLKPKLFRYDRRVETYETTAGPKTGPRDYYVPVRTIADAQCLFFLCPKCFAAQGSNYGVHGIEVTFADRGVPDDQGTHNKAGNAVRWKVSGDAFQNLTTTPSILLEDGCAWHGFITGGQIT